MLQEVLQCLVVVVVAAVVWRQVRRLEWTRRVSSVWTPRRVWPDGVFQEFSLLLSHAGCELVLMQAI